MRSPRRRRVPAAAALAAALSAWTSPATATPPGVPVAVEPTGLEGGGFVNVVAVDPSGSGLVLAGGDVSGFHRSTDLGDSWLPANAGLTDTDQLMVAAIAFSASDPNTIYAAVGDEGRDGGFLVSEDGGVTWDVVSTVPQFSGGNNTGWPAIPNKHPRSTGNLIALDEASGLIYVATFHDGVMRSLDGGATWTTLGLDGAFLRGLALDPGDPDVLYAAAYGDAVYVTHDASGTGTFTRLGASPSTAEELLVLGSDVYAAAGSAGVFRSSDGGASWASLGAGTLPTGPIWEAIDGYIGCDGAVLYVGAEAGGASALMRSTDGGTTWGSLAADPSKIHTQVGGPGGPTWWLAAQPRFMLGGQFSTVSQIALDPEPPPDGVCLKDRVLVAGRSGIWRSTDGGTEWYPAVNDLSVTIAKGLAFDPLRPGRAYAVLTDWVAVYSDDDLGTVVQDRPPGGSVGIDVAVGSGLGRVYVASGDPARNARGEVFSSADPATGGWLDEGLSSVAGARRPLAVAARKVGTARVILAAVEASGIWRKSGTTWTRVNAVAMAGGQPSRSATFVWPEGTATVYLFDHKTGVWRSRDSGRTWTKIWAVTSREENHASLAVDPLDPGRLYVSVAGEGIFRLDGALSGTVAGGTIAPVEIGSFVAPGPIAVDGTGVLYATERAIAGTPKLLRSSDGGATWEDAAGAGYVDAAGFPLEIAIDPSGRVFLALQGNGVFRQVIP